MDKTARGYRQIPVYLKYLINAVLLAAFLVLGNALLSHILHLSLPAVWHTLFLPTTSVTTVLMEQHLDSPEAHARLVQIGDTSHLYAGDEPVSPSGLFTREIR